MIFYITLPAYCFPKAFRMETGESNTTTYLWITSTAFEDFPWKIIGWRNWVQKLLNKQKAPNQPNQTLIFFQKNSATCCYRTNVPFECSGNRYTFLLTARIPICLLNVWSKTKTDKDVDADRERTVRPVESEQSIGLFTQREEIDIDFRADRDRTGRPVVDIDFRVSGLPHAVEKQAENSRVREFVKKIESHPHRQDSQADLQQSYAYNPCSANSNKMIQDMGNVELLEVCETFFVQCSECLLYWNQGIVSCTFGHHLRVNNPADISTDGNWILSESRTMSLRRCDTMAIVMGRLKNK